MKMITKGFVAGTLILTKNGYIPIEEIEIGDKVLTHNGRCKKIIDKYKNPEQR